MRDLCYILDSTRWKIGPVSNNPLRLTVYCDCPNCGGNFNIPRHSIAKDGEVTPDVMCPYDACDFRATVRLSGWGGRALAANA